MFKRKHTCKCCGREFCDACTQKKSVVPVVSPQAARVCETCYAHLSRSDRRCLSRLVPYLADPKEEVRSEALGEVNTLLASGTISPAELAGTACARELGPLLASPQRTKVSQAASVIAFALRHAPAAEQLAEPGFCKSLVAALVVHGVEADGTEATAAPLTAALAAIAATERGRGVLLAPLPDTLRAVSSALSSTSPEVTANAARVIELLATDASGKPLGESDAESAAVFALVPLVRSADAPSSPAARASALAALDRLCDREHGRLSFAQNEGGIAALLDLASTAGAPEADAKHAMSIIIKIASQEECAGALQAHTAKLIAASLMTTPTAAQAMVTLAKLARADCTQRSVTQELLLDHAAELARLLAVPAPEQRAAAMDIVMSVMSTHTEIAGGILREQGVVAALAGIVRERGPSTPAALHAFAQCGGAADDAGNAGIAEVCVELLARSDKDAISAFPLLAAQPAIAARLAMLPQLVPTLAQLLGRGTAEPSLAAALCAGVSALCVAAKPFAAAAFALGSPLLPLTALLVCSSNTELQVQALRMAGAIASADPRAAEALATSPPGLASALCGLLRPSAVIPAVLAAALGATGAMVAASPTFRAELLRNNGVSAIVSAMMSSGADNTVRERAAAALVPICAAGNEERAAVRAARGIPALAEMLFSAPNIVKAHAAASISFFALGNNAPQDCAEMQSLGIPIALVGAISAGSGNIDALRETAAHALGNIFQQSDEARRGAFEAGVLPAIIDLIKTGSDTLKQQGIWVLRGLLYLPAAAEEFSRTGIDTLQAIAADATVSQATKDAAIGLSVLLAGTSAAAMESFAANAGVGAIVAIVASPASPVEAKKHAAEHLARAATVAEWLDAILAAKGVQALATLAAADGPAQAAALAALAALCAASADARRALVGFAGGIDVLLRATWGSQEAALHALATLLTIAKDELAVPALLASPAVQRLAAIAAAAKTSPKDVATVAVSTLLALASHKGNGTRAVADTIESSHSMPGLIATLPATDTLQLFSVLVPVSSGARAALLSHENALTTVFAACAQEPALALIGGLAAAEPAAFARACADHAIDVVPLARAVAATATDAAAVSAPLSALAAVCSANKSAVAHAGASPELAKALPALVSNQQQHAVTLVTELACSEAFRKSVLEDADIWCEALAAAPVNVRAVLRLSAFGPLRTKLAQHAKLQETVLAAATTASPSQADAVRALWCLGAITDPAALFVATIANKNSPAEAKVAAAMAIANKLGDESVARFVATEDAVAALCNAFIAAPSASLLQMLLVVAVSSDNLRSSVLAQTLKPDVLDTIVKAMPHLAGDITFLASLVGTM